MYFLHAINSDCQDVFGQIATFWEIIKKKTLMNFVIQGCVVVQESPCRVFDPMPVHMVTDKVAQKHVSDRVLQWSG